MADPTRPPPSLTVKEESNASSMPLNVSLIVIGPSGRHAVVNGVEVKIGDTIGGYQLVAIKHQQIVLRRNGVDSIATIPPKHIIRR